MIYNSNNDTFQFTREEVGPIEAGKRRMNPEMYDLLQWLYTL